MLTKVQLDETDLNEPLNVFPFCRDSLAIKSNTPMNRFPHRALDDWSPQPDEIGPAGLLLNLN